MYTVAKPIEGWLCLWVVGKVTDEAAKAWEMQGVFSDKNAAISACRDYTYFVGPVIMNMSLPHDTVEWFGAFYPIERGA